MANLSRRACLTGALALASTSAFAQSAVPNRYSAVSVDIRPLRALGLGQYADAVAATLQRELASEFADRVDGRGPRLIVRVDAVSLRSYAGPSLGGGASGFGNATQNDYMEGEALIVGPRGEIIGHLPQLSALPSGSGGAYYLPDFEQRRLVALSQHFAGWLRRRLG